MIDDVTCQRRSAQRCAAPRRRYAQFVARSRPHLPDAGGAAHHAVIPYTYFGQHRSRVLLRLRHDRARHRQLLHGDVLLPVGTVRLVRYRPQGSPRAIWQIACFGSAYPFVICAFTVIPLAYYAISLRHHPEIGFSEFWWNMITEGPWPSGPIWFLWVLLAFDLVACLLYRLSPAPARPDQPPLAARARRPACRVLRGHARPSPPRSTFPGWSISGQAAGSSSGRSRCSTGA